MKKLLLITITVFIILLLNPNVSFGQTTPAIIDSEQILVRTHECFSPLFSSEIIISYGGKKTERVELESMKAKNWEKNVDRINYVLNKVRKQGYKLIASNSGGGDGVYICTYVFVKDK